MSLPAMVDKIKPRLFPAIALAAFLAAGCGELRPLGEKSYLHRHTVSSGETLFSIAWRYGFDYRQIAAWNGISPPYQIFRGQELLIIPRPGFTPPARPQPSVVAASPEASAPAIAQVAPAPPARQAAPAKAVQEGPSVAWQWPTKGRVTQTFGPDKGRKGLDIGGQTGQEVIAAAAGDVVYSGSGLIGYGNLIIIKHTDTYLSAYAHNSNLLVKEGARVTSGQKIAEMGQTSKSGSILHFEIRKNGQPVDPLQYLPKQIL